MTDLYAELITDINKAVDTIESGETAVAKARYADSTPLAQNAGNAERADYADSVISASNADYVPSVENISPQSVQCKLNQGIGNCILAQGVYYVMLNSTSYLSHNRILNSVFYVGADANATYSTCLLAVGTSALDLTYTTDGAITIIDWLKKQETEENGTLYFYKIGNIHEE